MEDMVKPVLVDFLRLRTRNVPRQTCRSLWTVDHDAVRRDLEREQENLNQEMKDICARKYNFDLEAGVPLKGKYDWQPIEHESSSRSSSISIKTRTCNRPRPSGKIDFPVKKVRRNYSSKLSSSFTESKSKVKRTDKVEPIKRLQKELHPTRKRSIGK